MRTPTSRKVIALLRHPQPRFDTFTQPSVGLRTEMAGQFRHALVMIGPQLIKADLKRTASGERGEYLIDGFRVSFLHQAEWRCACREFSASGACRHTREAGGMREAQALIRQRLRARSPA